MHADKTATDKGKSMNTSKVPTDARTLIRWLATGVAMVALAVVPTACGGGGAGSHTTTTRAGY